MTEEIINICAICGDEIERASEYYFNLENKKCYHLECFLEKRREARKIIYGTKLRKSKSSCASSRG